MYRLRPLRQCMRLRSPVMVDNVVTIVKIEGECQWCTNCELVCPTGAIVCPFEVVFEEVQYERLENNL